ncbi:hypothetical protein MPSEU_000686600 [Mayamaea pseudoterrestris]|nr:hypothetical protein MPSEU_000686600 [Mayamaea pseudoterrestris]
MKSMRQSLPKQCRLQARAMMNHKVRDSMHFYYDYRLVSKLLLGYDFRKNKFESDTPPLLVIRTELLWSDWVRVNEWLSGDAPQPVTQQSVLKIHDTSLKQLVVTKTLDSHGQRKLCRALAEEYRMYSLLIQRAVNLSPSEKRETMNYAKNACPEIHWERLPGPVS